MDRGLEAELRRLVDEGRKIEAIKVLREATGCGLAEAKAAVDGLERGEPLPGERSGPTLEPEVAAEVRRLVGDGRKIDAIALYRERTGLGLKESKDAVEELAGLRVPGTRSGCLGIVLAWFVG